MSDSSPASKEKPHLSPEHIILGVCFESLGSSLHRIMVHNFLEEPAFEVQIVLFSKQKASQLSYILTLCLFSFDFFFFFKDLGLHVGNVSLLFSKISLIILVVLKHVNIAQRCVFLH